MQLEEMRLKRIPWPDYSEMNRYWYRREARPSTGDTLEIVQPWEFATYGELLTQFAEQGQRGTRISYYDRGWKRRFPDEMKGRIEYIARVASRDQTGTGLEWTQFTGPDTKVVVRFTHRIRGKVISYDVTGPRHAIGLFSRTSRPIILQKIFSGLLRPPTN